MGQPPSAEFVKEIRDIVSSYPQVKGIHDLIVHDYGPGRVMVSLHAEVDKNADLLKTHDVIDNIEKYLAEKLGCSAVIHMDPIASDDEYTIQLKEVVSDFVKENISPAASIHDFRTVRGTTHTNIIFDILIPYEVKVSDEEIKKTIRNYLESFDDRYFAVITVDEATFEKRGRSLWQVKLPLQAATIAPTARKMMTPVFAFAKCLLMKTKCSIFLRESSITALISSLTTNTAL